MKKPFMFGEAKLPTGYPPPGPVGEVMVKNYPASRIAMVQAGDVGNANQNSMFQPLFNHIKKENISMTSPVVMGYSDEANSPVSMAFVYTDASIGQPGADGNVRVVDVPEMFVASVGIRGSYNEAHFQAGLAQIRAWLSERTKSLRIAGPPRYLGYNSPFVPWFLRYGEVQIPVGYR